MLVLQQRGTKALIMVACPRSQSWWYPDPSPHSFGTAEYGALSRTWVGGGRAAGFLGDFCLHAHQRVLLGPPPLLPLPAAPFSTSPKPQPGRGLQVQSDWLPSPEDWSLHGLESTPRGPGRPWEAPVLVSEWLLSLRCESGPQSGHTEHTS